MKRCKANPTPKRQHPGRPRLSEAEPTLKRTVTAPFSHWLLALKLGGGNVSLGWRELVKYWLVNHPDDDLPFTDLLEDDDTPFKDELEDYEGIIPFLGELMQGSERGVDPKLD